MGNQISVKKNKVIDKRKSFSTTTKASFTTQRSRQDFILDVYPTTVKETNRQRGEHYLLKYVFQTSYFAPIQDILVKPDSKTLDIGCGSQANWLIDVARDFSESTFYGFDIVDPFGPTTNKLHIPSNCIINKQDLFNGFEYNDNTFDYVHQRMMHLIYHSEKLPWMFQEILRVTKENGWIELVEPDTMPKKIGPLFSKIFAGGKSLDQQENGL
jgi:SAM-dependent methyltransferase